MPFNKRSERIDMNTGIYYITVEPLERQQYNEFIEELKKTLSTIKPIEYMILGD